jgi:3-phenylpropionate/trans-cinnamate dioxygenase ferredoxin reductase subunit
MRQLVRVTFNGSTFSAYPGDVLLDAALRNGVGMPHDCRAGTCDSCRVRVVSGETQGGECPDGGGVLACQTRVMSDLEIASEVAVRTVRRQGRLEQVTELGEEVIEVAVSTSRPLPVEPGQHIIATFRGYPARAYCPTRPLDARAAEDGLLRFHVARRVRGGVSAALGRAIKPGCRVEIAGPYGRCGFRRGLASRLVLVCEGTGFAPAWAIADAALRERADRSILLIVGVRSVYDLYMVQALDLLATCAGVRILVASEERQSLTHVILPGRATDYLPPLLARDIVYAAGPPALVDTVGHLAKVSGATFGGDAFVPIVEETPRGWLSRLMRLNRGSSAPEPAARDTSASLAARLGALPSPREEPPRRGAR